MHACEQIESCKRAAHRAEGMCRRPKPRGGARAVRHQVLPVRGAQPTHVFLYSKPALAGLASFARADLQRPTALSHCTRTCRDELGKKVSSRVMRVSRMLTSFALSYRVAVPPQTKGRQHGFGRASQKQQVLDKSDKSK